MGNGELLLLAVGTVLYRNGRLPLVLSFQLELSREIAASAQAQAVGAASILRQVHRGEGSPPAFQKHRRPYPLFEPPSRNVLRYIPAPQSDGVISARLRKISLTLLQGCRASPERIFRKFRTIFVCQRKVLLNNYLYV